MTASADPLARLVVDESEVNREFLASLLQGRVRLDPSRSTFAFQLGMRDRLSNRQLVLVALLAQKALHLLADKCPQGLRPQEIEQATGVKGNTLRPILKLLLDRKIIGQNDSKAYLVPVYAMEDAAQLLTEQGE